jgi:hypothetical protein
MEQRLSLIPLGVSDVSRAQAFYEKLRWHLEGVVDDEGDQSPSSTPPGSSSRFRLGQQRPSLRMPGRRPLGTRSGVT